jgi:hypothetical protein
MSFKFIVVDPKDPELKGLDPVPESDVNLSKIHRDFKRFYHWHRVIKGRIRN